MHGASSSSSPLAWLELPGGKNFPLGAECRIGRHAQGNDLVLDERAISSRHGIISRSSGAYVLVDLHSTNGTYVNGHAIQRPTALCDGDEIQLAKCVTLRFRCSRAEPLADAGLTRTTTVLQSFEEIPCFLFLADVAGFSGLIAHHGQERAVQQLQTWLAAMRPLIEGHGGTINRYVGDAIFAWWPCHPSIPAKLLGSFAAMEQLRLTSPVSFRYVVHYGQVVTTRSEVGEELTGQEVNFLFRSEKIAKQLGCSGLLSEAAVQRLRLEQRCEPAGLSSVEGIAGEFRFYRTPRSFEPLPGNTSSL